MSSSTTAQCDGWIQTYTGDRVWPMQGRGTFRIEDIAHALSNICRFGGHTKFHYSVAQHSCYVSTLVPPEMALAGLLHDAAEAYLGDIPRPIKHGDGMSSFRAAEVFLEDLIFEQFGIEPQDNMFTKIKKADSIVLATERRDLMAVRPEGDDWLHGAASSAPMVQRIMQWTPACAEIKFLERYKELVWPASREDGGW